MTSCRHMNIVLLPGEKNKLRCRHCHLVITPDELQGGYCPECYAAHGKKHHDFEEIEAGENEKTHYRCEDCGVIIEVEEKISRGDFDLRSKGKSKNQDD